MPNDKADLPGFDAVSVREITPAPYDPNVYGYRYANGAGADRLPGFVRISRELQKRLVEEPRDVASLAKELRIDDQSLQRILDYLFTHTGDVAALEVTGRETLYIWAGTAVAEDIRARLYSQDMSTDTTHLKKDDIAALTAYITNLIVLNPPTKIYRVAIEKCRKAYDSAKVLHSIRGGADLEQQMRLLSSQLSELVKRRDSDLVRWSETGTSGDDRENAGDGRAPASTVKAGSTRAKRVTRYPSTTVHLLGPSYTYSGPDADKRFRADDPVLNRYDFQSLRKLVVEIDTFIAEIEDGVDVLSLVERHIGSVFPKEQLTTIFRQIPGLEHTKKVARRLHKLMLEIRKRGYRVTDNPAD